MHSSQLAFRKILTPSAVRKLTQYDWPGNIRELCNVIQRAALLAESVQILARDIMLPVTVEAEETAGQSFRTARRDVIDRFERRYIEEILQKYSGNISRAARAAGQERRAFGRLVKKHGLHTART
jgi:DNA-binding NtrC family response regulator